MTHTEITSALITAHNEGRTDFPALAAEIAALARGDEE